MTVNVKISGTDDHHGQGVYDGNATFCSATCAIKYLSNLKEKEDYWLNVWKAGKILGTAIKRARRKVKK